MVNLSSSPQIHVVNQGILQGSLDLSKRVARYLNVPYGVVQERWRPAVKPEPWTGVRDATKQGPICPQGEREDRLTSRISSCTPVDIDDETAEFDEKHCLNLNIFVHEDTLKKATTEPAVANAEGAAVIVFIHGGGYRDGANSLELYDGSNLVHQAAKLGRPVIVVVPNYRLNFHGFFACPELEEDIKSDPKLTTDYERVAGNWGLQDQRLAFEWVHNNIATFGGNPSNITAMGELSGASSIGYHMLIPQHRGLFHQAIMHSSASNTLPTIRSHMEGKLFFDFLVDYFNIPKELSGKEKLELLKKVPSKELGRAAGSNKVRLFSPYVDGVMILEDIRVQVHKADMLDHGVKAVMIGNMSNGGEMFVSLTGADNLKAFSKIHSRFCPPDEASQQLWEKVYGKVETDLNAKHASMHVFEDYIFTYPIFSTLRALSKRKDLDSTQSSLQRGEGLKLYQFYFDRSIKAVDESHGWGAHHGIDLVYVFGPDYALEKVLTEEEKRFSERVQTMWIHFAYGETAGMKTKDGAELFPARITQPVDDYKHHSAAKEAIVFTPQLTVEAEHAVREGKDAMELWERSEKWVHDTRRSNNTVEALRVGFMGVALPADKE
ncbi:Alpha/Beta hydrolase protein [Lobosporangium transversale]|uniref:Alpha/Beta hydrolase protein n=1 Tax=Lobosporangium transversale TaxID=64571 RepID=A0A1Y2GC64_9FUNG|nr:Alpha/Beta hydrolase protein [Lobosporangium transversale]ORZ06783.1 Alpha/Beta hydrolase protein [Lobosporangium transversale]|eukprot:XP_021877704.1 Alpha/Beta hydrolase protein [Lobosporangium transversale]